MFILIAPRTVIQSDFQAGQCAGCLWIYEEAARLTIEARFILAGQHARIF